MAANAWVGALARSAGSSRAAVHRLPRFILDAARYELHLPRNDADLPREIEGVANSNRFREGKARGKHLSRI